MTNKTSNSSNSLPNLEPGATDSPWQPSWWHWLISALSGTVEIEKQDALEEQRHAQRMNALRKSNEELRKSNEELRKSNEEFKKNSEEFKKNSEEFKKNSEELKSENKRLAELESKIDGLFSKYGIKSSPAPKPEQP